MRLSKSVWVMLTMAFTAPVYATCWSLAEHTYSIDAELLKAVAFAESGMNPGARNSNANQSYDVGLMQINSFHFPRLEKMGITEKMLYQNPCLSLMVGASILSEMIDRYGYGWEAVGAYNAGTARNRHALREKYANKISGIYMKNTGAAPW